MKQHIKHHFLDQPRPPEGTVLPLTGMIVGPAPRGGPADVAKPLRVRRPDLFNGTWRNAQQRRRDNA